MRSRETLNTVLLGWVEYPERDLASIVIQIKAAGAYKHFSSTTLITLRMPFEPSLGVGTAAREPSPRNKGPSSDLES